MRPQKHGTLAIALVIDPQGVPHVAGRVISRDAKGLEVVVVPLNFGALYHLEPQVFERLENVSQSLSDWV